MATLSLNITVPDNKAQEILDAYAAQYGYDAAGGLTKAQFLKQGVIEHIRQAYLAQKLLVSQQAARVATQNEINSVPMT
jgi:hypothetical protein